MADYLEQHGGESVGAIFDDLYGQVNGLATELYLRLRATQTSQFQTHIPGTDLEICPGGSLRQENEDQQGGPESWHEYRIVSAHRDDGRIDLLHLGEEIPRTGREMPSGLTEGPSEVGAYAAFNCLSAMPQYFLRIGDDQIIGDVHTWPTVYLGEEPEQIPDFELKGSSFYSPEARISRLDEIDAQRLKTITNAIQLGIVRTELLREGADFYTLFGLERPPEPPIRKIRKLLRLGQVQA